MKKGPGRPDGAELPRSVSFTASCLGLEDASGEPRKGQQFGRLLSSGLWHSGQGQRGAGLGDGGGARPRRKPQGWGWGGTRVGEPVAGGTESEGYVRNRVLRWGCRCWGLAQGGWERDRPDSKTQTLQHVAFARRHVRSRREPPSPDDGRYVLSPHAGRCSPLPSPFPAFSAGPALHWLSCPPLLP